MDLDVLFLGTAGSSPSPRRGLPATLVRRGGDRLLFDCGEGTQRQLMRSVGLVELEELFITHFHADHVLGLPGMLKTFALRQRERDLVRVRAARARAACSSCSSPVIGRLTFPRRAGRARAERRARARRLPDRRLRRGPRRPGARLRARRGTAARAQFDPERARELGVRPGPDFGRLQQGEEVDGVRPDQVMGEARRGRKIVLTGDTAPCDMTRLVAWEADLLVHEATFMEEDAERAAETRHSTAAQAAELAAAASVHMLALTHISPRYSGGQVRDEARAAFENVIVPRDFDSVEIPFPERGEPVHIRASDRPPEREPVA